MKTGTWHDERRAAILKAHPEVYKLMGNNPWTAVIGAAYFTCHTAIAMLTVNLPWWQWFALNYVIGGWWAATLSFLSHEGVS